jgi:hypothetical protein
LEERKAHEWMIEFKILLQMYHNSSTRWIYTIFKFRLQAKRYNNMTLNPLIINVARKICFTIG